MAKVLFNEGARQLADSGWPTTLSVALSTKPCSGSGCHVAADTLAGGIGEITGTGYDRQDITEPAATGAGVKDWPAAVFATGVNTNWSSAVKSAVFVDEATSKAICAVDLSATRDMAGADRTLTVNFDTSTQAV